MRPTDNEGAADESAKGLSSLFLAIEDDDPRNGMRFSGIEGTKLPLALSVFPIRRYGPTGVAQRPSDGLSKD